MGLFWTFHDYVDEKGDNAIHHWLNTEGKDAKAKFNRWIRHLEATAPGGWRRPLFDTLTDECQGLFEIRVTASGMAYRLLGFHGPGQCEPTLALGLLKNTPKVPPEDCKRALAIRDFVIERPSERRVEHDFNGKEQPQEVSK